MPDQSPDNVLALAVLLAIIVVIAICAIVECVADKRERRRLDSMTKHWRLP